MINYTLLITCNREYMSENFVLTSPDDSGWYWFKKSKRDVVSIVYVNSAGIATKMNEEGEIEELDDLLGQWEPTEAQLL